MGGVLLTGVIAGWALLSLWAAHRLGAWLSLRPSAAVWANGLRLEIQALALVVLLPLPLIDELLAKPQFDALCRDQVLLRVISGAPSGTTVRLRVSPPEPVPGLMVPVSQRRHLYLDPRTQELRASFNTFQAQGGKLARLVGQAAIPWTFDGHCGPADLSVQLAQAGLRVQGPEDPSAGPASH